MYLSNVMCIINIILCSLLLDKAAKGMLFSVSINDRFAVFN